MRERIIALYEQQVPTKQISEQMGTCRSATRRIRQQFGDRGTLDPLRPSGGYASGLTDEMAVRLRERIAGEPGSTRQQLRDHLGVSVDVRTIGRWLGKLGLVLKKSRSSPPNRNGPMLKSIGTVGTRS